MFKVGDKVICIKQSLYDEFKLPLNKVCEIENINKDKLLSLIESSKQGHNDNRFRLATPAEVRKLEGFGKELEELINEN